MSARNSDSNAVDEDDAPSGEFESLPSCRCGNWSCIVCQYDHDCETCRWAGAVPA